MSDRPPNSVSVDDALDVARKAPGPTLLVIIGPKQAERLHLAIQIADAVSADERLDRVEELIVRYVALKEAR